MTTGAPLTPASDSVPLVRLHHICKRFGTVQANQDISLDIRATQIKALLGENGAGKSTLMAILAGKSQQDSGTIEIDGQLVAFRSPKDALKAGIGMVYQHFMLVDSMTVAENIFLGQRGGLCGWLNPASINERVTQLAAQYGLNIDPRASIRDLSMGERQRVEIMKLLFRDSRVLILDEPTAVLTPPETEQLFSALRRMAAQGKAIVFISHKMQEVLDLAHEVSILRKGRIVDTFWRKEVPDERELASRMIGREMLQTVQASPAVQHENVLTLENLSGETIHDLNLTLRRGGIVAIAGVAGNGQRELVEVVAGLCKPQQGRVTLLGTTWEAFFATPPLREGMGYIPEDRQGRATCQSLDLVDNFLLTNRHCFVRGPFLERRKAEQAAHDTIRECDVQPGNPRAKASELSGGNLQKLVVGREFFRAPRLILAENPTQGLDIAAMEEVWRRLLAARKHAGILLVTSDLNEAFTLADTIAVLYRGRFMDVFPRSDTEKANNIGMMMAGVTP
ncbi:MAG: ABC transporter ATP-binding protein [Bilophila sp.]